MMKIVGDAGSQTLDFIYPVKCPSEHLTELGFSKIKPYMAVIKVVIVTFFFSMLNHASYAKKDTVSAYKVLIANKETKIIESISYYVIIEDTIFKLNHFLPFFPHCNDTFHTDITSITKLERKLDKYSQKKYDDLKSIFNIDESRKCYISSFDLHVTYKVVSCGNENKLVIKNAYHPFAIITVPKWEDCQKIMTLILN